MNEVEEILKRYEIPKRLESEESSINEIESRIGFKLPEDYKGFLLNYQGFESLIGAEYVSLWDLNELAGQNEGYLILENLPNTFGIGSNGASELIALEKIPEGYFRVILTPFIDLNSGFHIHIGDSFTDFLLRLDKGQEWFNEIKI